jgi:hypothetical protein
MLELNERQRAVLIDKLPDAANLAAGALVFGQFLSDRPVSLAVEVAGIGLWLVFTGVAVGLARKARQ